MNVNEENVEIRKHESKEYTSSIHKKKISMMIQEKPQQRSEKHQYHIQNEIPKNTYNINLCFIV